MELESPGDQEEFGSGTVLIPAEYYLRPFYLLNEELIKSGSNTTAPHPIRGRYWGLVIPRRYEPDEARPLLKKYIEVLESELATVLMGSSIAYWLHLYRRIFPSSIGADKDPKTVVAVRMSMEAAIQKFAEFVPCHRIAVSNDVKLESILNGLLMHPDFQVEREIVESAPQLVLTDFGTVELIEFYSLEKLAYEIWKTSALLRAVGKGAPIIVIADEEKVLDERSDELNQLIRIFDDRDHSPIASATATVYADDSEEGGRVLLPGYNAGKIPIGEFEEFFRRAFQLTVKEEFTPNFIWAPLNLKAFYQAHKPLAAAFFEKNGASLPSVLSIVAALMLRVYSTWMETKGISTIRHWQMAYDAPLTRESINREINAFLPAAMELLELNEEERSQVDISEGIRYFELTEEKKASIDLEYPGPHHIFLPFGDDHLFIDYAWLVRSLYNLFWGTTTPDQNFKGLALEKMVSSGESTLPTTVLRAFDGSERQIDSSFRVDERLVIVECRANYRSIAFDRGDPHAVQLRIDIVNKILKDTDEKAQWLSKNPRGHNYDISWCNAVIAVGVTPFVEFIPSLTPYYWLEKDLPRVLTPRELVDALDSEVFSGISQNIVTVSSGPVSH